MQSAMTRPSPFEKSMFSGKHQVISSASLYRRIRKTTLNAKLASCLRLEHLVVRVSSEQENVFVEKSQQPDIAVFHEGG